MPTPDENRVEIREIPVENIIDPLVGRIYYDKEALEDLKESIKKQGLLNPIMVVELSDGKYRIIHGSRRFRAIKELGWEKVPCRVVNVTEAQELELAVAENLIREEADPITLAYHFHMLKENYGMTVPEIAARFNKSDSFVRAHLRLLELPQSVQALVIGRQLSVSHALEIARLQYGEVRQIFEAVAAQMNKPVEEVIESYMLTIAKRVIEDNMTVIQTRALVNEQIRNAQAWMREVEKGEVSQPQPEVPEGPPMAECPQCHRLVPASEITYVPMCKYCLGTFYEALKKEYKPPEQEARREGQSQAPQEPAETKKPTGILAKILAKSA